MSYCLPILHPACYGRDRQCLSLTEKERKPPVSAKQARGPQAFSKRSQAISGLGIGGFESKIGMQGMLGTYSLKG